MFLNPKYPDIMYTVSCSEIHPETVFRPTVLRGEVDSHVNLI